MPNRRIRLEHLPYEILCSVLEITAHLNEQQGVTYTFGLSQAPLPLQTAKLQKYVRGPVPPDMLRWDATASIREVCRAWHDWSLEYALKDVYIRRWRGSERWAELSQYRGKYNIYELIDRPSGAAVYRDPHVSLRHTRRLFSEFRTTAVHVRRLWFNGFYSAETSDAIFGALRFCINLTSVSLPWTTLRYGTAEDWASLLDSREGRPLEALELLAVDITDAQATDPQNRKDYKPLKDKRVSFSKLKRLKAFGNSTFMPITDRDLYDIARTATSLEDLHITGLSTVSIKGESPPNQRRTPLLPLQLTPTPGLLSLIKSSHSTLRIIEHSPRSDEGFDHPHPGLLPTNEHICTTLTSCPNLHDLSISLPSMCPALFATDDVKWAGEIQIRAARLCPPSPSHRTPPNASSPLAALKQVLDAARALTNEKQRCGTALSIEIFFANSIFDPHLRLVHGDFDIAAARSDFVWPRGPRSVSRKGPYGATGLYGKGDGAGGAGEEWVVVGEEEWGVGVERGWVRLGGL